jgi:hypothetical protein
MMALDPHLLSTLATELPYLNPGTGGLIIQLLLGALFAIGLTARILWSRIKKILHLRSAEPDEETASKKEKDD